MFHLGCQIKIWVFWAFLVLKNEKDHVCLHSWFVSNDSWSFLDKFLWCHLKCIVWVLSLFFWEASMLGHGAGIGYMGPSPQMGPIDNFSLVMGSSIYIQKCYLQCGPHWHLNRCQAIFNVANRKEVAIVFGTNHITVRVWVKAGG